MLNSSTNNKRIAKNTLLLYFRMLFTMIVGLFTSRVILNALGVEDFGIYNVVGGVVAMFSMISGSLNAAISRFLTYELGTGNKGNLNKVFSSAVTIQILLAVIIIVLAETIGIWFLNTHMTIPENRIGAANWVYQFSILTFAINLINVPFNASIISHEQMSVFAYISIIEVLGKLVIAYGVYVSPMDKLIFYSMLLSLMSVVLWAIYVSYCKIHFEECTYHISFDRDLLRKMFSFAGWNFIGASAAVLRDQGGNIIINIFFGPAVNAARGIAMQVSGAVQGFVANFQTALNPQITKNYASGNYDYMMKLVFQGARLSYCIMFILALPIIITAPYLLYLWLGIVPEHTVNFVRLVLIFALSETLAGPLITAMLATGNIRNYQIAVGSFQLLNVPISYVCLKFGLPAESVLVISIVISVVCEFVRLWMLRSMIRISARAFLKNVYLNVIVCSVIAFILPYVVNHFLPQNLYSFLLVCAVSVISACASIYYVGLSKPEKNMVKSQLIKLKNKL